MVERIRKRQKPHLMDKPAQRYMFKVLHKNQWRLPDWMEWEDLVGVGVEAYYFVRQRYPDAHDKRHIMALFMRVLKTRIDILSNSKSEQVPEDRDFELESLVYGSTKPGSLESLEDTSIAFALDAVPTTFRALLTRLITEGVGEEPATPGPALQRDVARSPLYAPYRRFSDGLETLNDRLCWLGGFDPKKVNIVKILQECLGPQLSALDIFREYLTEETSTRTKIKSKRTTGEIYKKLEGLGCSTQQIERHIRMLRTSPRTRAI